MTPPEYAPLVCSVANVLKLFFGEQRVTYAHERVNSKIRVTSYREDFDCLWGIGDEGKSSLIKDLGEEQDQETTIILVYDGVPQISQNPSTSFARVNVADYVSVYDWAIYLLLSLPDSGADVRLLILDVTSKESNSTSAAETFPALLPSMPWVRVCSPFDVRDFQEAFEGGQADFISADFLSVVDSLIDDQFCSYVETETSLINTAKELALEIWRNHLTKPGKRHDVSNLIAPLILARGLDSGDLKPAQTILRGDQRYKALEKLLHTIGVLDSRSGADREIVRPLESEMVERNIFGQFDRVRLLLIDDLADHGYHDAVASLLFGSDRKDEGDLVTSSTDERFIFRSLRNADVLVENLYEAVGIEQGSQDRTDIDWDQPRMLGRSSTPEGPDTHREFDILLLDLRLFRASPERERQTIFLERLVDFYERTRAEKNGDEDLKRAYEAAKNRVESEEEQSPLGQESRSQYSEGSSGRTADIMHLALLPLLLSYVDPSLPIVVFSSTRQQAISDALGDRPGIITTFRKPVISGYAEGLSSANYVVKLSEAISEALRQHEKRCVWGRIIEAEWTHEPIFEVKGKTKGKLRVYNSSQKASPEQHPWKDKTREYVGKQPPIIRGEDVTQDPDVLRRLLAEHYERYIATPRYFDYVTTPLEVLEGALVPSDILEIPEITNAEFALPEDLDSRNKVAGALRNLRNKKAHGFIFPSDGVEVKEKYRIVSIVIFMVFLDFIEGGSGSGNRVGAVRVMRDYLNDKYTHINRSGSEIKPYHLTDDSVISLFEATIFTLSFTQEKAVKSGSGKSFLSNNAIRSIHKMIGLLVPEKLQFLIDPPSPHPNPESKIGEDERIVGEVKFYNKNHDYGFIKGLKGENVYFHATEFEKWIEKDIPSGTLLEFSVEEGAEGPVAKNIRWICRHV